MAEHQITIRRERRSAHAFVYYHVWIDDQRVGRLLTGQVKSYAISPGEHRVRISDRSGAERYGSETLLVVAPPGAVLVCRPVKPYPGAHVALEPVPLADQR